MDTNYLIDRKISQALGHQRIARFCADAKQEQNGSNIYVLNRSDIFYKFASF